MCLVTQEADLLCCLNHFKIVPSFQKADTKTMQMSSSYLALGHGRHKLPWAAHGWQIRIVRRLVRGLQFFHQRLQMFSTRTYRRCTKSVLIRLLQTVCELFLQRRCRDRSLISPKSHHNRQAVQKSAPPVFCIRMIGHFLWDYESGILCYFKFLENSTASSEYYK